MRAVLPMTLYGLLLCLLTGGGALGQHLELEYATGVPLPDGPVDGLYVGPRGGMFAQVRGGDGSRYLLTHAGRGWRQTHVLRPSERIVPAAAGALVLADGGALSTYAWRLDAAAVRIGLGRLPGGARVRSALFASPAGAESPELIVGTDAGVYACGGGACTRLTTAAFSLVGAGCWR